MALSKNASRLRVLKGQGPDRLMRLRSEDKKFDLIYIDGSLVAYDVLQDVILVCPCLKRAVRSCSTTTVGACTNRIFIISIVPSMRS